MREPWIHRRTIQRALATVIAATTGLGLAAALAMGSGTTLYAAPGAPASGKCDSKKPCDLSYAISQATAGNTVIVTPGTYSVTSGIVVAQAIVVEGDPTQPRPSLVGTASLMSDVLTASSGATVFHLDIQTRSTGLLAQNAALVIDGATAEDVTASAGSGDSNGAAIVVKDSSSGTTLRTALAVSAAPGGEAIAIRDSTAGAGTATVVNLTAVSTSSSTDAISGNVGAGTVALRNVIATGAGTNISRKLLTRPLSVAYSNFASATSGAVSDGGGNSSAPPVFVNAGAGDYHEATGSPTIATGSSSAAMSTNDLDGNAWPATSPDMGAYEFQGATSPSTTTTTPTTTTPPSTTPTTTTQPSTTPTTTTPPSTTSTTTPASTTTTSTTSPATTTTSANPEPGTHPAGTTTTASAASTASAPAPSTHAAGSGTPPAAPGVGPRQDLPVASRPVARVSATLGPSSGTVVVELPGTRTFVPLARPAQVPMGTVIDTTRGAVTLTSASGPTNETRTGIFHGGRFTLTQTAGARPLTLLRLTGGSFAGCSVVKPSVWPARFSLDTLSRLSFAPFRGRPRHARRSYHHVVRQLWGSDAGGHFVTIGRSGSAAVRGTVWLTQDRCDGTLVRVLRGRVFVKATRAPHGVTVGAGHQYLIRAR